MDEVLSCPQCGSTIYKNPSLVLNISTCGHTICNNCIEVAFIKGSGNCPECGIAVRRTDFRVQLFDDNEVDKEVYIRRRIMKDCFKREEDFDTLAEYNDYLEEIESMVYDLTYNVKADEINRKIEQFKKNKDKKDERNKRRYGTDILSELEEQIEFENKRDEERRKEREERRLMMKQQENLEKENLIDQLSYSDSDANSILNTFFESKIERDNKRQRTVDDAVSKDNTAAKTEARSHFTHFSSGQAIGGGSSSVITGTFKLPKKPAESGPLYVYQPLKLNTDGPEYPTEEEIIERGYAAVMKEPTALETASGLSINTVCTRLLQEAMAGLYFSPHKTAFSEESTAAVDGNIE